MKKTIATMCLSSLIALVPATGSAKTADDASFGLSGKFGTLGAGLDLTYKINKNFNTRFNVNGITGSYSEVEDGISYKGDLDLFTMGLLLDYHPFDNGFRVSGGLYNNRNEIKATSNSAQNADVGGTVYDITGKLNSDVGFKSTAPYLGIGWGNAVKGSKKLHFSFDAGVLFQGTPEAKLTGTGTATAQGSNTVIDISSDPTFQDNLRQEEQNLNDDLENFKYYPVVSLGISYSF